MSGTRGKVGKQPEPQDLLHHIWERNYDYVEEEVAEFERCQYHDWIKDPQILNQQETPPS